MARHEELPYWLALRRAGLGSSNFSLLLARFGSITDAWQAPAGAIKSAGIEAQYARAIEKARTAFDPEGELARLDEHGVRVFTWLDEDYPSSLRDIPQSPPVLFVRGTLGPQFDPAMAIVGTRRVTPYGRQACELFVEALAKAGVAIISGLARGVDAIAHRCALEGGVPTVAVLAGGIDAVYPRENAGLADRILGQGCLVSEYPVGIPARPDYFPRRNRILSGLAKATLVVEAGEGSGALHTANWAAQQYRDVYAIPGSIFSRQSYGTNQLIREHTAALVTTPEQLLQELNLAATAPVSARLFESGAAVTVSPVSKTESAMNHNEPLALSLPAPSGDQGTVLAAFADEPAHIDEIVRASGLPVNVVSSTLQMLELIGHIRQLRPMVYVKA